MTFFSSIVKVMKKSETKAENQNQADAEEHNEHRNDLRHQVQQCSEAVSAADDPLVSQWVFTITEMALTWIFSWLKAPTSTFTFKTLTIRGLLRDCEKRL